LLYYILTAIIGSAYAHALLRSHDDTHSAEIVCNLDL